MSESPEDAAPAVGEVMFASFPALREIAGTRAGRAFVWPDEGSLLNGDFRFNAQHAGFEPLWVDPTTADLLVKVHDLLNPQNREKFERWIALNRGTFAAMVEFCWERAKSPPTHAGSA